MIGDFEEEKERFWKELKYCITKLEKARLCECMMDLNNPNCPYTTNEEFDGPMGIGEECGAWGMHLMSYCYVRNGKENCFTSKYELSLNINPTFFIY